MYASEPESWLVELRRRSERSWNVVNGASSALENHQQEVQPPLLLVTTWGDPRRWREVTYILRGREYRSRTTLFPVLASLLDRPGGAGRVRILIIVPDTLAADIDKCDEWRRVGGSWKCVEACVRGFIEQYLKDFESEFARESAHKAYLEHIDKAVKGSDVVVCPGLGRFILSRGGEKLELVFEDSIELFALCAYLSELSGALRTLQEQLSRGGRLRLRIVLDTSYGVNYVPALTTLATFLAAEVLALWGVEIEELRLVNSDPVLPTIERASINESVIGPPAVELSDVERVYASGVERLIEKPELIFGEEGVRSLVRGATSSWSKLACECLAKIELGLKALSGAWHSLQHGYALALAYIASSLGEGCRGEGRQLLRSLVGVYEEALRLALRSTEVVGEEGAGGCTYKLPTAKILKQKALEDAHLALKVLAGVENAIEKMHEHALVKQRSTIEEQGLAVKELKEIYERLSGVMSRYVKHFYGNEIRGILVDLCAYAKATGSKPTEWVLWRKVREAAILGCKEQPRAREECEEAAEAVLEDREPLRREPCTEPSSVFLRYRKGVKMAPNDRNFIAHLGLAYDLVELKCE